MSTDTPTDLQSDDRSTDPLPEVTVHVEPAEQGGARYHRCEGCGRETIYGADRLPHARGCPRRAVD